MPVEFAIRQRADHEAAEEARLAFCAARASEATRRLPLPDDGPRADVRTAFQRDRDRIMRARAFRRLKHKTQVYMPHVGDHPRTRLTHTLEVAQLGRTIARALGLNEDLTEAVALAHDLGHTAFGHSGERALARILAGEEPTCPLPATVVAAAGTFKHNYQSVRVVDLLEHRYDHPGLNLTDEVREGILKHTSWKVALPFPLPTTEGLRLDLPCHLEGQVVALADELAQQTHDLEDGLGADAVSLAEVTRLQIAQRVIARLGARWEETRGTSRRTATLVRGLIDLVVGDAVATAAAGISRSAAKLGVTDHATWRAAAGAISASLVALSPEIGAEFAELKAFIYRFIINHQEVNRQDWRATLVVSGLFRAYHSNPLTLPTYALRRFAEETGGAYLRDLDIRRIPGEVAARYHADPTFVRIVVDHLAGMSDRFALEEHEALYHPHAAL